MKIEYTYNALLAVESEINSIFPLIFPLYIFADEESAWNFKIADTGFVVKIYKNC